MKNLLSITLLSAFLFYACKKDKEVENPFDDPSLKAPETQQNIYNPDPQSFVYLYNNIFKPTCANSNCHDGAFEPDFRTITSSYNTLVYAPVVMTSTAHPALYRVMPGNAEASMIKHRLTQIPGAGPGTIGQGRMPFIDTSYKFSSSGAANIQSVINWINNGAKDIFGNAPSAGNKQPRTQGFQVCNAGSNIRKQRGTYLEISKTNGPVDLWFSVTDDVTAAQNLELAEVKISKKRYDFSGASTYPLVYTTPGNTYDDVTNTGTVLYSYKLSSINLASLQADTGFLFVRSYFKDPDHSSPAETPNNGSAYLINHFVIKIMP